MSDKTKTEQKNTDTEETKKALSGFDMSQYVANEPLGTGIKIKKKIVKIPVGRPNSQTFFRSHPSKEYHFMTHCLTDKEENKLYVLNQKILNELAELSDQVRMTTLYLCVNSKNDPFLFPVPLPDSEGRWNSWHESQSKCVKQAQKTWIRMQPNRSVQGYDVFAAEGNRTKPEFPNMPLEKILSIAFDDSIIDSMEHPLIKKLRGIE